MKNFKWLFSLALLFFILAGCSSKAKVVFDTGTAETIEPLTVEKGEVLTDLPEPEKEGYDFKGWFLDDKYEEAYVDQPVKKNIVLYAKWEIKKFTVVFKNGNTELKSVTVEYGAAATPPAEDPTRPGHTFTGWDKEFDSVTENMVVNALFEQNVYTVTFKDGDEVLKTQDVPFGGSATAPTPPEKEGYAFTGWDKDFDDVTEDLLVNAVYEPIYFEVKFVDDNGAVIQTLSVRYGEAATAPDDPIKAGYEFSGWDGDFNEVKSDLEITATYQIITYTITYYEEDIVLDHAPASYNIETGAELEVYQIEGLEFLGWYIDSEFSGEPVTSIPVGSVGDIMLYGRWTEFSIIKYELNGGSWFFTTNTVTNAENGIDAFSNLPEILMIDIYTYLKDNNLLTSSAVASSLRKTNWDDFSKNYTDPVAIYNHTTTNTTAANDGYSQLFFTEATGNAATGELISISGGFFGEEPYKSKYLHLIQLVSYMVHKRYTVKLWDGEGGKSLTGFVLDGYLYGTQSIPDDVYNLLRKTIPQPNKGYRLVGSELVSFEVAYPVAKHLAIEKTYLSIPHKEGHAFGGWYTTSDFTGERVYFLNPGEEAAEKYYAKWIPINEY